MCKWTDLACQKMSRARILALALILGFSVHPLAAANKRSDAVVNVQARAESAAVNGVRRVLVTLAIQPGWHLYANPVGPAELHDAQTTITLPGQAGILESVDYPPGKATDNELLGTYRIYEGTVTIPVLVRAQSAPTDLLIRFQACSNRSCLPPANVVVTVPATR